MRIPTVLLALTISQLGIPGAAAQVASPSDALEGWTLAPEPTLSLGQVEGMAPDVFGGVVGAVRLSSGAIVIADEVNLAVSLFDKSGEFVTKIGRRGAAPGEFELIKSIWRCGDDSVHVFDPALSRLTVLNEGGRVGPTIDVLGLLATRLPPTWFRCGADGTLAFIERPPPSPPGPIGPHRPHVPISIVKEGALTRLGEFAGSERYFLGQIDGPRPLGKTTEIAVGPEVVYVGTADAFELLRFSHTGQQLQPLRYRVPRVPVSSEHVDTYVEGRVAERHSSETATARRFYTELEYPSVLPAHGKMLIGSDGYLWVQEYWAPGATEQKWHIFAPGERGDVRAVLTMRSELEVLDAGPDYVLVAERDALDVPRVLLYPLIKNQTPGPDRPD